MSIKGLPIEGNVQDIQKTNPELNPSYATLPPVGGNRRGLDTVSGGFYEVTAGAVVEAGSDSNLIKITGHTVLKGDLIRIVTSANGIIEKEMFVAQIVDADNFRLFGATSADFAAGDTINIMRWVSSKLAPDGATLATVVSAPVRFVLDGVSTEVTEDTVTPGNNVPLPVKLTSVTGDINITANDLNVQLSDQGVNADVTRIGDGTNQLLMNASGEATVNDADLNAALGAQADLSATTDTGTFSLISLFKRSLERMTTLLSRFVTTGAAVGTADVMPVGGSDGANYRTILVDANGRPSVDVNSSALPTGAATETTLANLLTELQLKADLTETQPVSLASQPLPSGAATETTLANLLTELQLKADLTETQPVSAASLPLPAGAATEATLAAMSAKLPAALGQTDKANSMSVTIASDQLVEAKPLNTIASAYIDTSSTNITDAAYVEIIGDIGGTAGKKIKFIVEGGYPMYIATGAAASEVNRCIAQKGGFTDGPIEVEIAANSRISLKTLPGAGTMSSGYIYMNIMG